MLLYKLKKNATRESGERSSRRMTATLILTAIIFFFVAGLFLLPNISNGETIDELRQQIKDREQEIKELEAKSAQYKESLKTTNKQSNTLAHQISQIEDSIAYLNLQIKTTQTKIIETTLKIKSLKNQIDTKESDIEDRKTRLSATIKSIYQFSSNNAIVFALSVRNFSDLFSYEEYLNNLQKEIRNNLDDLKELKLELEVFKNDQENKNQDLKSLYNNLGDQKTITQETKSEKDKLLGQTKNKEKEYQKLIASIYQQRKDVEQEINVLEAKLRQAIDRSKLPVGKGILQWPIVNIMTQGYGKPNWNAAYDFHNGIDIRAAVGTPVRASLSGKIIGVGNNGRYSYGKWIAIDHGDFNIITLYGHLSLQKVKIGEEVNSGEIIGYSGSTGYSTGPHLHFSVFASESYTLLKSAKVPNLFIPIGASINPLDYL